MALSDWNQELWTHLNILRRRWLTKGGTTIARAVTATATSVVVTFRGAEQDTNYGVIATPNWGTTVWVTGKTTTQCTVNFGTAAPANAAVDVVVFRRE